MKVTLINTSDAGGGAPAACLRLLKALQTQKVDAKLLVQYKKTDAEGFFMSGTNLYGSRFPMPMQAKA
jgi:hypothetical protein